MVYFNKRIHDEDLRGCINLLADEDYIDIVEKNDAYIRVTLTHKGRHFNEYERSEFKTFLMKSIVTPIIVAFITTLITLWLNGRFGR